MPIVALTGGVAAGKSTVTAVLHECGAVIVDADVLARDAVAPGTPTLEAIRGRFGPGVVTPEGDLDRAALGAIVFSDEAAREALNDLVHPVVRELSRAALAKAQAGFPHRVLIYALPLLAESRSPEEFDLVVVVDAPAELRAERLRTHRGFSESEALERVRAQASDEERLALADIVVDSRGDISDTRARAKALYDALASCWPERVDQAPTRYKESQS